MVGLPLHTSGAFAAVGEEFVGGGPEVRERDFGAGRADQLRVEVVIPVPRVVPVCRVVGHVAAGCAAALSAVDTESPHAKTPCEPSRIPGACVRCSRIASPMCSPMAIPSCWWATATLAG